MQSKALLAAAALACARCSAMAQVVEDPPQVQRSAEVFPSGSAKVIRMESHRAQSPGEHSELLESTANASEAQYPARGASTGGSATTAPPDEKGKLANAYCGGPAFISTCGFKNTDMVTFTNAGGQREAIRGLCVCTDARGCIEPICDKYSCSNIAAPECADGNSCIKTPGEGWECWHPCNAAHSYAEYGNVNGNIVKHIREVAGACAAYGIQATRQTGAYGGGAGGYGAGGYAGGNSLNGRPGAMNAPTEPPLDGGIDLTYQSSPIFGSQVSATKSGSERKCATAALFLGLVSFGAALSQ